MSHRGQVAARRFRAHNRNPQPRQRRVAGHGSGDGSGRIASRHRGCARRHARLVEEDGRRTREDHAALVRSHARECRGSRRHHDRRARQAAGGIEGRDRLCGLVHRMVRRGRQAHLRRHHSRAPGRQTHHGAAPADWRGRRDHAVEFSRRDDHAQSRAGARRGLHVRLQAGAADAVFRAGDGRSWRNAPAFHRACSTWSPARRLPSAASSPETTRCARCRSPVRLPWANYSWRSARAR